jgi:streptomycin 6-kinase
MATMPGRLAHRVRVVAEAARLEPRRLLAWIVAWAGLSAAFSRDDGLPPDDALEVAGLAAMELSG